MKPPTTEENIPRGPFLLRNYITIAFRIVRKKKTYAFINILGLAIGMACFVLIGRYILNELSYDAFFDKANRIHRIVQQQPGNEFQGSDTFAVTPAPLADALMNDYPEVEVATAVMSDGGLLSSGDENFYEGGLRATRGFFNVFSFRFRRSNPAEALEEPRAIVLTETLAAKLFPLGEAMGRRVSFRNEDDYTVAGIIEDVPENSHLQFSFVVPLTTESNYVENQNEWSNSSWYTYFILAPGHDANSFAQKMPGLVDRYYEFDEDDASTSRRRFLVQRLLDIHLRSHINFEISSNGDIKYVFLFGTIGLIILLLACVNYMNLAVARSVQRAREVGLRKVVGARRGQLVAQFLGESLVFTLVAFVVSIGLVLAAMPVFSGFIERDLALSVPELMRASVPLTLLVIIVGLLAGSYPALFVSKIRPALILKGRGGITLTRSRTRRLLVTGQIAVSILLMIGSLVILKQLRYIQERDLGYEREHIVSSVILDPDINPKFLALREELLSSPNILKVSASSHLPTNIASRTSATGIDETGEGKQIKIYQARVSYDFLNVFDIPVVEGRNFSAEFPSDSTAAVLINETAMRDLGWTSIDGKSLQLYGDLRLNVIGVVGDFNMHSLRQPIEPLMLKPGLPWRMNLEVRIGPENIPGTLATIKKVVAGFSVNPVRLEFLDEVFDQLYKSDQKLGQSIFAFTLLALLIGALGLFGLAAYSAEQRRHEIGVRKTLGATVFSIVGLLSRELAILVAAAFAVGAPLAYILASNWLDDFSYRVSIDPGIFVLSILAVAVVAWLSIAYQSFKAAHTDPVKALRSE